MRVKRNMSPVLMGALAAGLVAMPVWAQSLSQDLSQGQQPSRQQIEAFCANWGQLSGSQRKQYRAQYDEYCDRPSLQPETTIIQPVEPEQPQPQQPSQKPQEPEKPAKPEEPSEPEAPEPQIQPAKPEPVIPEPEPLRVDLVGELALAGPLARQPGERQRLRVTVANRGPGGGPHAPAVNRLWARVFLSDRDVSRQGASAGAFAFSGARQGHPVRLPGVPRPGRSREVTTEVTLPAGTPDGNYWWCLRLDTRQQVEETDEENNTACVRKVVALGGTPDSELSGVFGSKVDELSKRRREDTQTASQPSHPGLLRQSELDRMAAMLRQTGGRDYTVLTGQAGGDLTEAHKRGLLLMRDRGEFIPLGGDYYKDGRGNMVIFGELPGSADGAVPYALTLFAGGGLQLVTDTDRDGLIDVGVSEGLKERFGFLARPGMEHILDCMNQMVQTGTTGAAESLPECLSGGSSDDGDSGGDGGGVGGGPGSDLDSALEPDCGQEGPTSTPTGFTQGGGGEHPYVRRLKYAAMHHRQNAARHRRQAERQSLWDSGTAQLHLSTAAEEERLAEMAERAADKWERWQAAMDSDTATDEEKNHAVGEAIRSENEYRRARDKRSGASAGKDQPGGDPTMPPEGSGSDPRCEEPSTWNRLATEECVNDTAHCINKFTDPLYAGTDGQCRTERGPDDSATIQCDGNDSFGECLADGGGVEECREQHAGGDERGETPGENDELFEDDQGSVGYGLLDVHAFGATLAAMCQQAGGIGPCGDPSPAMDALREEVREQAR